MAHGAAEIWATGSAAERMREHPRSVGGAPAIGMPLCLKWDARAEVQQPAGAAPPRLHQITQVYQARTLPCAPGIGAAGEPKPPPPSLEGQAVWESGSRQGQKPRPAKAGREGSLAEVHCANLPTAGSALWALMLPATWLWAGICLSPQQGVCTPAPHSCPQHSGHHGFRQGTTSTHLTGLSLGCTRSSGLGTLLTWAGWK